MKTYLSRILSASALVMTLIFTAGCATPGAGADPMMMSDLLTERQIQRTIYETPQLAGSRIRVSCLDMAVTLAGNVENSSDKAIAERIAADIDGVTEVINLLSVSSS